MNATISDGAREALYATGYALFSQERFVQAAEVFRMMLELCPDDERSWLALGECHSRAGHDDLALRLFSAGVAFVPNARHCALARYRALRAQADDVGAAAALDVAVRIADETGDDEFRSQLDQARMEQS